MASFSSPSPLPITTPQEGYDVFISFRGKDTRNNFISHLHAALCQKLVLSFIDSKHLTAGDEISAKLLEAIEGSKLYLVIFSPNYASSKWCLLELEKILECKKMKGKTVMPVFYKVDPSHVRYQNEGFGNAFRKHERREKMDRVQRWRDVLNEAASLSGWASLDARSESELIKNIVNSILEKLNKISSTYSKGLIGIDRHVEKLKSLLFIESPSPDVCSVGIWGMGGIGKTTIAKVFFDRFCSLFSGFYFFENVREELERHGAVAFCNKLLQEILDEKDVFKGSQSLRFSFIRERVRRKRVAIVFDDVDDSVLIQLPDLAAYHDFFGPGSKIVFTCRDKQVLENFSVDEVYRVDGLDYDEAIQLFNMHAFKNKHSPIGHNELVKRVISYAEGNPLALKVLGLALFGRERDYWECALDKIEKFSKQKILAVLRVSYDGLPINEKNIFLDIACFFKGENKDHMIEILDKLGGALYCSVTNLIDKSLVTISRDNKLEMHNLLQEMGWAIVREESYNPEKRSRLHDPEEIHVVLTHKKGTEAIRSIIFDLSKVAEMYLPIDAFLGMNNLRLLKITGRNPNVHILGHGIQHSSNKLKYLDWNHEAHTFGHDLGALSNDLRFFYWERFPFKSLPSTFCGERLIHLSLPYGNFEKLWVGTQRLVNLKWLNLSYCFYLTEIPDLSHAKNIKTIDLLCCERLLTLHSSVQHLTNLQSLGLSYCESLRNLPSSLDSKSLLTFDLHDCSNIQKCPYIISPNLRRLRLDGSGIKELPPFIEDCELLESLGVSNISNMRRFRKGSTSIQELIYISSMSKFPKVPTSIQELSLVGTGIEEVPSSIQSLTVLSDLDLSHSQNLFRLSPTIWKMKALDCLCLSDCPKLEGLPEILEPVEEGLRFLYLSDCYNLTSLPNTIFNLKSLEELQISGCELIRFIPRLPQSLYWLHAKNCGSLETLSSRSICNIRRFLFTNCHKLDERSRQKILVLARTRLKIIAYGDTITLPGTEIPQWFPHRSVGSSITVPLPSNPVHLEGITFCIVYLPICPSHVIVPSLFVEVKCYDELNTVVSFQKVFHTSLCFADEIKADHLLVDHFSVSIRKESLTKC